MTKAGDGCMGLSRGATAPVTSTPLAPKRDGLPATSSPLGASVQIASENPLPFPFCPASLPCIPSNL